MVALAKTNHTPMKFWTTPTGSGIFHCINHRYPSSFLLPLWLEVTSEEVIRFKFQNNTERWLKKSSKLDKCKVKMVDKIQY
jgi:hypothetical protein